MQLVTVNCPYRSVVLIIFETSKAGGGDDDRGSAFSFFCSCSWRSFPTPSVVLTSKMIHLEPRGRAHAVRVLLGERWTGGEEMYS